MTKDLIYRRETPRKKAVSAKQMLELDRFAIERIGIPSLELMENAGRALAKEVLRSLKDKNSLVVIVCGTGNNGGDGFVSARHLFKKNIPIMVFLVGKKNDLKNDSKVNFNILENLCPVFTDRKKLKQAVLKSSLIIDALFGIGLNRELGDSFKRIIKFLNSSEKKIFSADVPSGLDATTGKIHGACIKAFKTITFSCPKKGFYKNFGSSVTGEIIVADIGIPEKVFRKKFDSNH